MSHTVELSLASLFSQVCSLQTHVTALEFQNKVLAEKIEYLMDKDKREMGRGL